MYFFKIFKKESIFSSLIRFGSLVKADLRTVTMALFSSTFESFLSYWMNWFHMYAYTWGLIITIFLAMDSVMIISRISSKESKSSLLLMIDSVNKVVSYLATSSDLLVKWRWMNVVKTSSLIFFYLENINSLIWGKMVRAFSNFSL